MTGARSGDQSYVTLVFDDGRGAAQIDFTLAGGDQGPCAGGGDPTCVTRADGSVIQTFEQREYPEQNRGSTERSVTVLRDGMTLTFSEWNAPTSKDSALTRAEPPLTIEQATAIVDNPTWSLEVPVSVASQASGLFPSSTPPTS